MQCPCQDTGCPCLKNQEEEILNVDIFKNLAVEIDLLCDQPTSPLLQNKSFSNDPLMSVDARLVPLRKKYVGACIFLLCAGSETSRSDFFSPAQYHKTIYKNFHLEFFLMFP